tara:strand:+ start:40 stop:387 length:348 start_codon:yes stop_codon:yes gene_type:complete
MIIPIKTDLKGFLKSYLTVVNPILKLKDKELEVVSAFLMVWYPNRDKEGIQSLIFSTKLRKIIRKSIDMSEASFNNHITALRKKQIFIDKRINPSILNNLSSDTVEVTYKLSWTK